jgi:segregation and condensation protein B
MKEPMSEKTPKALLEALLFATPRPLESEVAARLAGLPEGEVKELLAALVLEYEREGRGFALSQVAEGWQLRSRPEYATEVARLRQARPRSRYSRSAMETLAIVAYRQPIPRSEIEQVRGVDCGATLKSLMAGGMVRVIGRKEAPGRPILYGTTGEFLQYFSLRDLESLPTLEEVNELDEGTDPGQAAQGDALALARLEATAAPTGGDGGATGGEALLDGGAAGDEGGMEDETDRG